ncbi:hypothetical protein niasHT_013957 [Heterodera trifolii]|uniref:Piezo non-specific cation channel cap domain-containing protein n=1 Tax=Heterodera trifolii TaxID=157864 RepID=A0ABD2L1S8_9BILA
MDSGNFNQRHYNFRRRVPVNYMEQESGSSQWSQNLRNLRNSGQQLNENTHVIVQPNNALGNFSNHTFENQFFPAPAQNQSNPQNSNHGQHQLAIPLNPVINFFGGNEQNIGNPRLASTAISPHISFQEGGNYFVNFPQEMQNRDLVQNRYNPNRQNPAQNFHNPRVFVNSQLNRNNERPNRFQNPNEFPVRDSNHQMHSQFANHQNEQYSARDARMFRQETNSNFVPPLNMQFPENENRQNHGQFPNPRNFQQNPEMVYAQMNSPVYQNQAFPAQTIPIPDIIMELHKVTLSNQYANTMREIPILNGTEGSDKINDFFLTVEMCVGEWRHEKKLEMLKTKLKGKALRALNMALSKFGNTAPFGTIKTEIMSTLRETDYKEASAFQELTQTGKRKEGESVMKFGERIQRLVNCAHVGLSEAQRDEISKKFFVLNINDTNMAKFLECQSKPSQTYDELLMVANRLSLVEEKTEGRSVEIRNSQNPFHLPNVNQASSQNEQSRYFGQKNFQNSYQPQSKYFERMGPPNHFYRNNFGGRNFPVNQNFNRYPGNQQNRNFGNERAPSNKPRQDVNFQGQGSQNSTLPATNANAVPLNSQKQNFRPGYGSNAIIVTENTEDNSPVISVGHFGRKEPTDYEKFFNALSTHSSEFPPKNPAVVKTSKCLDITLSVVDKKAKGLMDSGAETDIVNPEFLYRISVEKGIDLADWGFCPNSGLTKLPFSVASFTGGKIAVIGVINVPISMGEVETTISCLITQKPFNYDFVLGPNALDALGYYVGNTITNQILNFNSNSSCENPHLNTVFISSFKSIPSFSSSFVESLIENEQNCTKKSEILDEKPKIVRSKSAPETGNVKEPINELVVVERGKAKGTLIKNMMGLPFIIVLILLVWSPIIAFGLINTIGKVQSPDSVTLIASLEGYPPIYKIKVQGSDQIKNIEYAQLEELKKQFGDLTERIKDFNDGLWNRARMAVAFINQYSHTYVLKIRFRPESEISWQISPDSLDALKPALSNNSTIKFNVNLEFTWPSPDGEKDTQKHSKTFKSSTFRQNETAAFDRRFAGAQLMMPGGGAVRIFDSEDTASVERGIVYQQTTLDYEVPPICKATILFIFSPLFFNCVKS